MNITLEQYLQMKGRLEKGQAKSSKDNKKSSKAKLGRPNLEQEQLKLAEATEITGGVERLNIKPLSSNQAWKGRRFKSNLYKEYTKNLIKILPAIKLPENPPYLIYFKFGFSSTLSDWDNPVKPTQDILASHYKFSDKLIRRAIVDVEIVEKGFEFIEFKITEKNNCKITVY